MAADSAHRQPLSQPQTTSTRIEYLDYRTLPGYREYRLALHTLGGSKEVRVRIAIAAFAASRVLLQDGPNVCYQRLLRALSAGETPGQDVLTIDDAELAACRAAHTPAPRRSQPPNSPPKRAPLQRTRPAQTRPKLPVAAPRPVAAPEPAFDEGQRVSHAVFGVGVTQASSDGRTSVQFDEHGLRTFVTSMVKLEPLSAPHQWQTGPRGKNRRRDQDPPKR